MENFWSPPKNLKFILFFTNVPILISCRVTSQMPKIQVMPTPISGWHDWKGQSHEIFCIRFFSHLSAPLGPNRDVLWPFWSIANFHRVIGLLKCLPSVLCTRELRLPESYAPGSHKSWSTEKSKMFQCTGESRLQGVLYTGELWLPGVLCTGESLLTNKILDRLGLNFDAIFRIFIRLGLNFNAVNMKF